MKTVEEYAEEIQRRSVRGADLSTVIAAVPRSTVILAMIETSLSSGEDPAVEIERIIAAGHLLDAEAVSRLSE